MRGVAVAAINTSLPAMSSGTMTCCQYGTTLAAVVANDSVVGMTCLSNLAYLGSLPGPVLATLIGVGRRDVIRTSPDRHLLDAVLVDGLLLVQALEAAVVAFIKLPGLRHGDPHVVRLLEGVV